MTKEYPEPLEKMDEFSNPADKTLLFLQEQSRSAKEELSSERLELNKLLALLPDSPPKKGSSDYSDYLKIQERIRALKNQVIQKHDELMEILKNEERMSREIQKPDSNSL